MIFLPAMFTPIGAGQSTNLIPLQSDSDGTVFYAHVGLGRSTPACDYPGCSWSEVGWGLSYPSPVT